MSHHRLINEIKTENPKADTAEKSNSNFVIFLKKNISQVSHTASHKFCLLTFV